jgi:hypothetical protein
MIERLEMKTDAASKKVKGGAELALKTRLAKEMQRKLDRMIK